jgi:probable HAF family extracellular repeat protein
MRLEILEGRTLLTASYTITDIGKLLGGNFSQAFAINAGGEVVGTWGRAGSSTFSAFFFGSGRATDLGNFGTFGALAVGVNNAHVAIGTMQTASLTNPQPTFVYVGGAVGPVNGVTVGSGHLAINDFNQMLGYSTSTNDATLYAAGHLTDLGSLAGHGSVGMGLNNSGQAVGFSSTGRTVTQKAGSVPFGPARSAPNSVVHPFLYQNGKMTDLTTLGGDNAEATAVNSAGVVVGYSQSKGDTATHPFSYAKGKIYDLGAPKGSNDAWATAINDANVVVGDFRVSPASTTQHAFIYIRGTMTDLNSLIPKNSGYTLIDATAINNKGQIVVNAINKSGQEQALVLTPVAPAARVLAVSHPKPRPHRRHR